MCILILLMLNAFTTAAKNVGHSDFNNVLPESVLRGLSSRFIMKGMVKHMTRSVRRVVRHGMPKFGIPPLDPLHVDHYNCNIPAAGLIEINLELTNANLTGLGNFFVNKSALNLDELSLDLDISVPELDLHAEEYVLSGLLLSVFPLSGHGEALFKAEDFRLQAKMYLKTTPNGILVDRIENISLFDIPALKSNLTGIVGGGNLDEVTNVIVEEMISDYVNRFSGIISKVGGIVTTNLLNSILSELKISLPV